MLHDSPPQPRLEWRGNGRIRLFGSGGCPRLLLFESSRGELDSLAPLDVIPLCKSFADELTTRRHALAHVFAEDASDLQMTECCIQIVGVILAIFAKIRAFRLGLRASRIGLGTESAIDVVGVVESAFHPSRQLKMLLDFFKRQKGASTFPQRLLESRYPAPFGDWRHTFC